MRERMGPGTRAWEVMKRVAIGVYNDGFIHAGNLAYLALLSLFPFVIVAAALTRMFGQTEEGVAAVNALLQAMPRDVRHVLDQPIRDVITARSGNLLWLGAIVGLWSTGSFIETIRDIIRRSYGVRSSRPFWEYRVRAAAIVIVSVFVAMVAFSFSILLSGVDEFVSRIIPQTDQVIAMLRLARIVPAFALFGSLYMIFYTLTPGRYRTSSCPMWPGPVFVTGWWVLTASLLPRVISSFGGYDLTYGSLAGVTVALIFFFIIGLGLVIGAELNAALAETPTPTPEDVEAAVQEENAEVAAKAADQAARARNATEVR